MTPLDWTIIVAYLAGMIALSMYLGRGQASEDDYFVGGRSLKWWAVGLSVMATQTSAISFISVPAFVALREGGGLTWLQYELAVPLAMIAAMVLLSFFRKLELISIYAYLEQRFGPSVRTLLSAVFLLSRGLAVGVMTYATGIVLSVFLGLPLWVTILVIGGVTVVYDFLGGMTAVVYSDVIQMGVLVLGVGVCVWYAADLAGGVGALFAAFPAERATAFDPSTGLGDGGAVPFWGFLIGGFFLYVSYYATDQSQAQRALSTASESATRTSLILNGVARFPLTMLYIALGIAAFAAYQADPVLRESIPAERLDYLVPQFVLLHLPPGLRAVLFAALISAAMSSLDSALNSLSAATMQDFLEDRLPASANRFTWSRITTVIWGAIVVGFAFVVGGIDATVIESINRIGSTFYGPILAAFAVGLLTRRATTRGVWLGIVAGVGVNVFLWLQVPSVHWMWWNLIGLVVAVVGTLVGSLGDRPKDAATLDATTLSWAGLVAREKPWRWAYLGLIAYFFIILAIVLVL
ncbi:MAG: sodium/solute symporter [Bacteroidota bacterium]